MLYVRIDALDYTKEKRFWQEHTLKLSDNLSFTFCDLDHVLFTFQPKIIMKTFSFLIV